MTFWIFKYSYNEKVFDDKKLVPSIDGDFNYLKDLHLENNINQEIKKSIIENICLNLNGLALNHNININNLKIKHFDNNDLVEIINNNLKSNKNESIKFELCKIIIKYLSYEDPEDLKDSNFKKYKDIRTIYSIIMNKEFEDDILETKHDSIWINVQNIILERIQKK